MKHLSTIAGLGLLAACCYCVAPRPLLGQEPAVGPVAPPASRPAAAAAAEDLASPTLVTLQCKDLSAKEALQRLAKQAGITAPLRPESDELWRSLDERKVTVDARDRPFWAVMREVCRQARIEPEGPYDGVLTFAEDGGGWYARPASAAGPALVQVASVSAGKTIRLGRTPREEVGCGIQFTSFEEPKARPLYWKRLHIDRITDDAGRPIKVTPVDPQWALYSEIAIDGTFNAGIEPDPAAKHIAHLEGALVVVVQTASEALVVDDIVHANALRKEAAGIRFTVTTTPIEGGYIVDLLANPPTDDPDQLQRIAARLRAAKPKLLDAAGKAFDSVGGGASGVTSRPLTIQSRFVRNAFRPKTDPPDKGTPGEAARFVMDVPTQTREVELPFDFADVPLP